MMFPIVSTQLDLRQTHQYYTQGTNHTSSSNMDYVIDVYYNDSVTGNSRTREGANNTNSSYYFDEDNHKTAYMDTWCQNLDADKCFLVIFWTYVTPLIFLVILLVGATGNILVIYVILSRREMRSITNLMLVNLAISDITFLFICIPYNAVRYIAESWPLGDIGCKIGQYALYVSCYVTIYTLVAISALRYSTVVGARATARYRTKHNAILLAAAIWLLTLTANVPTLLACTVKEFDDEFSYCGLETKAIMPIFLSFFAVGYAVPLSIIIIFYVLIVRHLAAHKPSSVDQSRARERNARTLRVIVLVVVVFGVSWLPTHVQALVGMLRFQADGLTYEVFRILWHCMMYGNSCVNPIIYHCASQEFRKSFRDICGRWCCCCRKQAVSDETDDGPTRAERASVAVGLMVRGQSLRRTRKVSLEPPRRPPTASTICAEYAVLETSPTRPTRGAEEE